MPRHPFLAKVESNRAAGLDRAEAFAQARDDHPELHADWLSRHNGRFGYQNRNTKNPDFRRRVGAAF